MNLIRVVFVCLLILIFSIANSQQRDSIDVMNTASKFIHAFNNFKWEEFRNAFSKDATIFYPSGEYAKRMNGRTEIEKTWLELFPEFLDSSNTAKLEISPVDLLVQLYESTAIVSFHLGDGIKRLSRRTLVMVKNDKEWKIVHLHASSLSIEKK